MINGIPIIRCLGGDWEAQRPSKPKPKLHCVIEKHFTTENDNVSYINIYIFMDTPGREEYFEVHHWSGNTADRATLSLSHQFLEMFKLCG